MNNDEYRQGYNAGIKAERQRITDNYNALVRALNRQDPPSVINDIIDLAIRQVITGDELGRPETGPSDK